MRLNHRGRLDGIFAVADFAALMKADGTFQRVMGLVLVEPDLGAALQIGVQNPVDHEQGPLDATVLAQSRGQFVLPRIRGDRQNKFPSPVGIPLCWPSLQHQPLQPGGSSWKTLKRSGRLPPFSLGATASYIAAAGFPFPLFLAWCAAILEMLLVIAFLTGAVFTPAAMIAAVYVIFLGFTFHGPSHCANNQAEFGFFVDHFTFVAGLFFAAVHGPGSVLALGAGWQGKA